MMVKIFRRVFIATNALHWEYRYLAMRKLNDAFQPVIAEY